MDNQHIVVDSTGLKCDNPACDWKDESIGQDNFAEWLNAPCPRCGQNLLTEKDLENAKYLLAVAKMLNSLSPEELKIVGEKATGFIGEIGGTEFLKDLEDAASISFDTHEEITITAVKPRTP